MKSVDLETKRLKLVLESIEDIRASMEKLPQEVKAQMSASWLALVATATEPDPWVHGFALVDRESETAIGQCGFKGPPSDKGMVEIAYGIELEHQGKGYASEAAQALVEFARRDDRVRVVQAHTLPEPNASTRVLSKCGFQKVGEVVDPEDGLVWRWEKVSNAQ